MNNPEKTGTSKDEQNIVSMRKS